MLPSLKTILLNFNIVLSNYPTAGINIVIMYADLQAQYSPSINTQTRGEKRKKFKNGKGREGVAGLGCRCIEEWLMGLTGGGR